MSTEQKSPRPLSDHNARVIKRMGTSLVEADVRLDYMLCLPLMVGNEYPSDEAEGFFEDMASKCNRRELAQFSSSAARSAKRCEEPSEFYSDLWHYRSELPLFAMKWSSGGIWWVHLAKGEEPGCGTQNGGCSAVFWTFGNFIGDCAKRAKRIARRRSMREWHKAYQEQHGCAWAPEHAEELKKKRAALLDEVQP